MPTTPVNEVLLADLAYLESCWLEHSKWMTCNGACKLVPQEWTK